MLLKSVSFKKHLWLKKKNEYQVITNTTTKQQQLQQQNENSRGTLLFAVMFIE